jgi:hypothetical protein
MSELCVGPCVICCQRNYPLSYSGPTICPRCDAGTFGFNEVRWQGRRIRALEEQLAIALENHHAPEDCENDCWANKARAILEGKP